MSDLALFDYSSVPAESAGVVRDAASRIKVRMSRTAQDIIEIGRDLIEVKAALGHGKFLGWIEAEFGMTDQSARRFMQVADRFGKSNMVLDLPPTALYELAAPSTTEPVRQEALARAEAGEKITADDIKRLKAQIAEKDGKLREIKGQKESVSAYNDKLIAEIREKSAEARRLADQVGDLQEELKRSSEPGTITVEKVIAAPKDSLLELAWQSAAPSERRALIERHGDEFFQYSAGEVA